MPTFVAMSSRNRWVAISTNGLLSGIRDSDAISALSLDPRAAHDERVDALVVPQEGTHVVLVDVHLGHVLRGDLRLPAPPAGGEEEAGERVPRHGDVLRDLLPEPFVEYAEIADRDVVHVFIVLVRHGLVRRTHPPDREPRPENRRDVAALAHRIQIPDDVPVDVRDRHVRERRNVAFDAEGGAGLPDGHVERGPSEVRLLAHAAREIVPHPLPELDDAVRSGLLDHVLDQGRESDVDHEVLRPPHTKELITCFRCARHSFSAFAATASPYEARTSGVIGRDSKRWRTTIEVLRTFARTPCIFVISTDFVVRKTRNARSPTPEMMIVPASNCWTDIIMFCPLS